MKRFTRLAAALLAAIGASAPLVAAPAASWVNFGGGIDNEDGTIKYYGGNTAYYITVSGGTRAGDGSYIQVGTPAVEATEESEAVAATAGSITLTVPSAVLTSKTITIVAEVQYLSAEANTLIDLVVGNNAVRLKSTGTQLQQCWNDTANYGSCDWTPTDRQRVTFTYQGASGQGSHTYLGDTPTAAAMSATNLMTTTSDIGTITLGKAATGLKIYSLYVYTTKLASASEVTTEIASNKAALAVPLSFAFSRAGLTADGNTMEVLQVGGGAAKTSTFTATLGTTATRVSEGSETDSTAFFKSVTSGSALLTTNGYAMVQSKFASTGSKSDEGWSIYLPFTPSAAATVTRVCPQLFAVTSAGAEQSDAKVFGYTVTLYSGSVDESSVSSATTLATATGTTDSLSGTTVNAQAAAFDSALTLNADTTYTMKLAVSDSSTGGGSYSGIGGVVFSSAIVRTVSGEGTWSANWTAGSAPADGSTVELTVSDAATLSMDAAATLASLTVLDGSADGSASLTFTGDQRLTSSATTLNVDTDVSAITASLGAVTLASGKTLTAQSAADFSSITAGSGATVKYTAPSGSIAKVDNATVELAAGESTISGITLPSAGGTYKVSSGTYTGMTLERTSTATTYAFTGGDMTFDGEFSFGTATATISGGTIRAPKMVTVQGAASRPTSVTQTGGEIILSGTTDGSSTTNAVVMFGHWPSATSTYTLSAGSIKAEQGGMRFGNDSPSTLNLSGTGLLKVKGIWGKGTTDCALNLSGGTLSIGSDGFKSIARLTVTATGGELNAFASNTIAQAIALNGPTTFSADAGCEMTVQGALSGSGALTIGTETATGTVVLGTQRPTLGGVADGATVKLTATEAELANNAITFSTTMGTAPAKERFTVVKPDGTTVTLETNPTVADGTLTVTLPQTGGLITATGNWSAAGISGETVVYVRGGESAESAITVTLDADLSGYTQIAVIGHVKFVTTETQPTLPTTIALESGSVLTATASFSGAYTIPSGATVVLDGTTAISSASVLTVNGALKTQGTVTLSGANAVPAGGSLSVETGTLTLTAGSQGLAGTINIAANATLVNTTSDALAYSGSPEVNVRGTLDMRSTRWTVGSTNTFNVYAGATIQGEGDQHGALDFYNNATHTLNVPNEGDASQPVTISAKLRLRQSGVTLKFNIALGNAKVYLTGIVRDVGNLEKAGAGSSRLILSGEAKTYTGATTVTVGYLDLVGGCTLATSGVTVASGAAVTFQADDASTETTYTTPFALTGRMDKEGAHSVILSGAITGAGAVNVKNGGLTLDASAATAEAPTAVANPITVGLDTGTAGTLTAKGFLTLSNASNTVKATGTLTIASGTTVLTTAANAGGIKGKLAITSGATLQCGTGDAPDYNGSPSLEIGGTLELTGETRWSIPSGATITLHSGALLKGTGPASGSNYAFDFFGGAAITADGDATIEANVGDHMGGHTLTITQSAGTTTISGEVRSSLGLSVAGSGTVVYAPASSVTATSSPLSVSSGATLQLLPAAAFTLNSAVTGAGTLAIGDGTAATAVTLATAGNGTDVTVAAKASLTVATGAGDADANKSFADGKTVTNNGTLTLTSGYGYFSIAGTGKTVVPGSNFLFGIGDANGTAPFSNGLEILASANFRIRPWSAASSRTIVATGTAVVNGSMTKDGGTDGVTATLQVAADTTLSGSSTFAIPVAFENASTATMAEGATFTFNNALSVPKDVTLPGTITLGEGAVLSGAGELSGTVTLNSGVIIDATESTASGYLGLTGTVTLGETLKVKASKLTNVLDVPTSVGLDLEKVSLTDDSTIPTGAKLMTSTMGSVTTLKFFVPPTVPEAPAESPRDASVDTQIAQAAESYAGFGMIISEVTAIIGTGTDGKSTREINGSSLFEKVLTLTPSAVKDDGTYTATATVAYDFGVAEMTIKSLQLEGDDAAKLYVLLAAKVQDSADNNTASFALGTKLTVLNGESELTPKSVSAADATGDANATEETGVQWLAVPLETLFPDGTGTRPLKVKASNASAAN